ncbi:potassium channel family protein [uncultured Shimia sp.]|uniref:potassium channel family protein n=1 Tax=uncultured Shimia sp. TaxID=573152 RepID=UPI0026345B1C|nr:potassium channel family protein [uncultured Shimia sp.]
MIWANNSLYRHGRFARVFGLVSVGFGIITFSHTVQVWIWAIAFLGMGVISDMNSSLYFALATYSTVGYGDLTLGPGTRIFGTFAGVSGVLSLGVSTAMLVAMLSRFLAKEPKDIPQGSEDQEKP